MGTVSIANALAFAPNLQKGLESAAKIFKLFNRVPAIRDGPTASRDAWVSENSTQTVEKNFLIHSYQTVGRDAVGSYILGIIRLWNDSSMINIVRARRLG